VVDRALGEVAHEVRCTSTRHRRGRLDKAFSYLLSSESLPDTHFHIAPTSRSRKLGD